MKNNDNASTPEINDAIFSQAQESDVATESEVKSDIAEIKKNETRDNDRFKKIDYNSLTDDDIIKIQDLRKKSIVDLIDMANKYNIPNVGRLLRPDVICAILKKMSEAGKYIITEGILDLADDGFGFLRSIESSYKSSSDDAYISNNLVRSLGLRTGDKITSFVRPPKHGEKFFACSHVTKIEDMLMSEVKNKVNFENLTPIHPNEKLNFGTGSDAVRTIDLVSPFGKGQRALIVAPPRTGKTVILQDIAKAINTNHPEVHLIFLGIDERPEEVTEIKRTIIGDVISSTFDEPAVRHVAAANIVIERAKRLVEMGKDVVILLDSITRLARAYNTVAPSSGKVLTGGVDSNALQKPKRFFGAARKIEKGGSLTIIATALVDTGSKMDEVIFEEFKGTGNSELVLDRALANRRIFPAIDILKSGTRKEEEMIDKTTLSSIWMFRKLLIQMANTAGQGSTASIEFLFKKLRDTKDNKEFFESMSS